MVDDQILEATTRNSPRSTSSSSVAISPQRVQHLGEVLGYGAQMPRIVTGPLAKPELVPEGQDQLPVGGGSIGIGLAQVAGGWHGLSCQGGENGERLAGGKPAVEHLRRGLNDLFDHNAHTPTVRAPSAADVASRPGLSSGETEDKRCPPGRR
jgi:hypothetical protein